jgi:hypothetical protein
LLLIVQSSVKLKCNIQAILVDTTMPRVFLNSKHWFMTHVWDQLPMWFHPFQYNMHMVFILSFDRIAQENKGNSKGKGFGFGKVSWKKILWPFATSKRGHPCTIVGYKVAITKFNKDFVQYYTRFWKIVKAWKCAPFKPSHCLRRQFGINLISNLPNWP